VLSAVLPEGVVVPSSFETVGHIGTPQLGVTSAEAR